MLERCLALEGGRPAPLNGVGRPGSHRVVQVVMPQNWLFLWSYRTQRERFLRELSWRLLARLGPGAFETIYGEVVNAVLLTLTDTPADRVSKLGAIDVTVPRSVGEKAAGLIGGGIVSVAQLGQLRNPDALVGFDSEENTVLLSAYATAFWGQGTLGPGNW